MVNSIDNLDPIIFELSGVTLKADKENVDILNVTMGDDGEKFADMIFNKNQKKIIELSNKANTLWENYSCIAQSKQNTDGILKAINATVKQLDSLIEKEKAEVVSLGKELKQPVQTAHTHVKVLVAFDMIKAVLLSRAFVSCHYSKMQLRSI